MAIRTLIAGVLLGALDFVWIKYVPAPFGGLGNSIAVWAVAAFLLAYLNRWNAALSVAGAAIMLVVAVPCYYVAASLIQHDDWSNAWDTNSLVWMGFGVIAGVVFGYGGVLARRPGRLRRPALALPAAVLLAEAVLDALRTHDGVAYLAVLVLLAVGITVLVARSGRDRALAMAWSIPLAAAGYAAMVTTAFHP